MSSDSECESARVERQIEFLVMVGPWGEGTRGDTAADADGFSEVSG